MTIEPDCERALLRLDGKRIEAWQGLARLGQSVDELFAIHIGNQNPGTSPFREFTACLSLESVEVVIKQGRLAGQRFR